ARERAESRETPQTPCPLVQPLARPVPSPTASPAMIATGTLTGEGWIRGPPSAAMAARGPRTRPARDAARQARSRAGRQGRREALSIPLIPATRPKVRNSTSAAAPMSAPPASAETGVKDVCTATTDTPLGSFDRPLGGSSWGSRPARLREGGGYL